jgi:hypothetical protein
MKRRRDSLKTSVVVDKKTKQVMALLTKKSGRYK